RDAVRRLATALLRDQIGVVEAAEVRVGDRRRLRGPGRASCLAILVAQLGLEDVALVSALLDLAQGAVPHALEGEQLGEERVDLELQGRVADVGGAQLARLFRDALALLLGRPAIDAEE